MSNHTEISDYLRRFAPVAKVVELNALNAEEIAALPPYWISVFSCQDHETRKSVLFTEWEKYPYQLASTTQYLKENLLDIFLINRGSQISMLYVIQNLDGKLVYYNGLNPKKLQLTTKQKSIWNLLPRTVTTFYENLHNGWFHYSSCAVGYSSTMDMIFLNDLEWGILDEIDISTLSFKLEDCITLFHNGNGGYVCYNIREKDNKKGFIWWKDESPELDEELCCLIDEWTVMGLEN